MCKNITRKKRILDNSRKQRGKMYGGRGKNVSDGVKV